MQNDKGTAGSDPMAGLKKARRRRNVLHGIGVAVGTLVTGTLVYKYEETKALSAEQDRKTQETPQASKTGSVQPVAKKDAGVQTAKLSRRGLFAPK